MRRRRPPGRAVESAGTGAGAVEGAAPEHGPVRLPDRDGVFSPTEREWHGITWQDVPGHDKQTQKLNFSLLKRGMLHRHGCCDHLHGEPLKLRLKELSERNRDNSQVRTAQDGRRRRHTPRPQPP